MVFILGASYCSSDKNYKIEVGLLAKNKFEPCIRLKSIFSDTILYLHEQYWYEIFAMHAVVIDEFLSNGTEAPSCYKISVTQDGNEEISGTFRLGQYKWQFQRMCSDLPTPGRMVTVKFDDYANLFMSPLHLLEEQMNMKGMFHMTYECWSFLKTVKDVIALRLSFLNANKFFAKEYYSKLVNYAIRNDANWSEVTSLTHAQLPNGPMPAITASNEQDLNLYTLIQAEIRQQPLATQFMSDVGVGRRHRRFAAINTTATGLSDHYYFATHWWYFDSLAIEDKRILLNNLLNSNNCTS
jgi:hypothetical protein